MSQKTHNDCSTPGCTDPAVFQPYDWAPNVKFCERHATKILIASVKSIFDGTHPDLQETKTAD